MNKSKQINNEEGFLAWYETSKMLLKSLPMPESFPCIVIWQNAHEDGFEDWHDSYEVVYLSDFKETSEKEWNDVEAVDIPRNKSILTWHANGWPAYWKITYLDDDARLPFGDDEITHWMDMPETPTYPSGKKKTD